MTPWTVTYEVPPSMEFSRQEYWSGLPFPSPGDLPDPGNAPGSPASRWFYPLSHSPGGRKCMKALMIVFVDDIDSFIVVFNHCFILLQLSAVSMFPMAASPAHARAYV